METVNQPIESLINERNKLSQRLRQSKINPEEKGAIKIKLEDLDKQIQNIKGFEEWARDEF